MYNKSIRVDLPKVTISINDVPEEAQKGQGNQFSKSDGHKHSDPFVF